MVVSFLPLAAGVSGNVAAAGLLAQALTATIGRWWAGRRGDRSGHARLLAPALAISSLGMGAMIWLSSPAAAIAAMCLFGAGFGILQNATLALMIDRMPATGVGTASALWNLAYDAGYGAGPAVFGLLVNHNKLPRPPRPDRRADDRGTASGPQGAALRARKRSPRRPPRQGLSCHLARVPRTVCRPRHPALRLSGRLLVKCSKT